MMIYLCLQSKNKTTTEKAIFRLAFVGYIPIIFPLVGLNELSKQFTLYMQMAKLLGSFKLLHSQKKKKIKAIILLKMKRHKPL